jgi:hypothetical protein
MGYLLVEKDIFKYPELEGFLESPGTALMAVRVRRYDVVHRFQDVVVWEVAR